MNKTMKKKPLLLEKYNDEVVPAMLKEFNVKNKMSLPKVEKVVVNIGLGEAIDNKGVLDHAAKQLAIITGQKPQKTLSRRSISTFKLRSGTPIGLKVTLRGYRMYDFLLKLIAIVFPRVRDFRGVSEKSFDKVGNYSLGFSDQTIFPEINFDEIDKIRGLEITIVTSGKDKQKAHRLLELLGMPFSKGE